MKNLIASFVTVLCVSACGSDEKDSSTASVSAPAEKALVFESNGSKFSTEGLSLSGNDCSFTLPEQVEYTISDGTLKTLHDNQTYLNKEKVNELEGYFVATKMSNGLLARTTFLFKDGELKVTFSCDKIRKEQNTTCSRGIKSCPIER